MTPSGSGGGGGSSGSGSGSSPASRSKAAQSQSLSEVLYQSRAHTELQVQLQSQLQPDPLLNMIADGSYLLSDVILPDYPPDEVSQLLNLYVICRCLPVRAPHPRNFSSLIVVFFSGLVYIK